MLVERSKKYFHGEEGYNCAQAIAAAFSHRSEPSATLIEELKYSGGGRASGGLCGALYAAEIIAADQDIASNIRQRFHEEVGAITCREIKRSTKTPCIRCVELAARFLDEELNKKYAVR